MPEERENLLADLHRETWASIFAMPRWAQASLALGVVGFLILELNDWAGVPAAILGTLRTAAFILLILGLMENARGLDEFYARVYLYASTTSLVLSATIIFALYQFGLNIGEKAISVMAFTFFIGFLGAFAYLRRA